MWDSGLELFFRGVCSEKSQCFALDCFWLFSTTPVSINKTLRAGTDRILCFCGVEDSRITAWRNILTTRNANCDVGFFKIGSVSLQNFFLLTYAKLAHFLRSSDFTGIQKYLIFLHGNKLEWAVKYAEISCWFVDSTWPTSFPGSTPLSRWRPREDPGTHRYDTHVDWSEDMDILTLVVIGRNCFPCKMTDLCVCICYFLCNRNEIIAG